jgi:F0F1-type ATP synthase membrane subunit b/b'
VRALAAQLSGLEDALEERRARVSSPLYSVTAEDVDAAELRVETTRRRLAKARVHLDSAREDLRRLAEA